MAHAHRVSKAIRAISGEDFLPPETADNPYLTRPFPEHAGQLPRPCAGYHKGEFAGEGLV